MAPSTVWKHFKKVGSKAVCECGEELKFSKSGATTSLSGHLDEPKKARTESVANLLDPNYSKKQSQELTIDLTNFIVDSNLPFSIATL
uniref:BED-type domain-containing protein n=1 Tax=Ditylenchus dipsaci TaxID=166011 RepID=A0A915E6J2_9BILA